MPMLIPFQNTRYSIIILSFFARYFSSDRLKNGNHIFLEPPITIYGLLVTTSYKNRNESTAVLLSFMFSIVALLISIGAAIKVCCWLNKSATEYMIDLLVHE